MRLTMREAASYLGVSESKTEKWVEERGLPAHRWDERWYVNPVELWEWAVEQGLPVSRALLEDAARGRDESPSVSELLRAGGIAIPHVRNPILLHVDHPFVALALLRQPVTFGAIDGLPVHALFMVITSSVSDHLGILARLAFVLHDQEVRALLRARAPAERILERVEIVESTRHSAEYQARRPT